MSRQKRSENTYQKIQTVFKRDEKNVIMPYDKLTQPEFEFLRAVPWRCEEKIDGTNIRLEVLHAIVGENELGEWMSPNYDKVEQLMFPLCQMKGAEFHVYYKGKTNNADIPPNLLKHLQEKYPADKVLAALGLKRFIPVEEFADHKWQTYEDIPRLYTIYGEGYGAKIQKAGENYIKDGNGFAVFDVKVDDLYLLTPDRDEIAERLCAPVVPFIGMMTIDEAIAYVCEGFKSRIAENPDFMAEGLVMRTELGLKTRRGERIITKLKTCDFQKYKAVYGTLNPVEQRVNSHITE